MTFFRDDVESFTHKLEIFFSVVIIMDAGQHRPSQHNKASYLI